MPDKPKEKRQTREPDSKNEQKTSDTVHLSAEELKKISGGAAVPPTTSGSTAGH